MTEQLSNLELSQIVAEVERLSQQQDAELDKEQVKQILQELNLPPTLLDEALVQLRRREALAQQQRRNRWITLGIIAAIVGLVGAIALARHEHFSAIAQISVTQERITGTEDNGEDLAIINRQASPEVFYRVTLNDAPVGRKLSLSCDWLDPNGQIMHQNRYQTQSINTPVWTTHCRHQFGPASTPGTWTVKMSAGSRPIESKTFEVR